MSQEKTEASLAPLPGEITELLVVQKLGVLATQRQGQPHASLVAFAAGTGGGELLFVTTRTSRKFANLQMDGRAAMLIDSRTNQEADFHRGRAMTATGIVVELSGAEKSSRLGIFLSRHPHLEEFAHSPSCALMCLKVQVYSLVSRFQHVLEYRLLP